MKSLPCNIFFVCIHSCIDIDYTVLIGYIEIFAKLVPSFCMSMDKKNLIDREEAQFRSVNEVSGQHIKKRIRIAYLCIYKN